MRLWRESSTLQMSAIEWVVATQRNILSILARHDEVLAHNFDDSASIPSEREDVFLMEVGNGQFGAAFFRFEHIKLRFRFVRYLRLLLGLCDDDAATSIFVGKTAKQKTKLIAGLRFFHRLMECLDARNHC